MAHDKNAAKSLQMHANKQNDGITKEETSVIQPLSSSPSQNLFLGSTSETRADLLIFCADLGVIGQLLPRRPDLTAFLLLSVKVLRDDLTTGALEEEGSLLVLRVQLTIDKDAPVEILLCVVAQNLVFSHDARIHVIDQPEVLFLRILMSPDFIGHGRMIGTLREELLDHHPMFPADMGQRRGQVSGGRSPRGVKLT